MKKEQCQDCVCLVADDNGEWICDECQTPCKYVKRCPEMETKYYVLKRCPEMETRYYVCGLGYDENNHITDY